MNRIILLLHLRMAEYPQLHKKIKLLFLISTLVLFSCLKKGPENIDGKIPFNNEQKIIADKIISCFENDDPTIKYGYIENLNDGRGYTAGKAGFTTGTGDLLAVVELYTQKVPTNSFVSLIPLLQQYASAESSSVAGLEQLPTIWTSAANDSIFIKVQDHLADSLYYQPAVGYAITNGIQYPLTLLCLYDACIQHGDGDDDDGLAAMIAKTNKECHGSPADGVHEYKWLHQFNEVRKHTLRHPANKDTQDEWRESTGRVDALEKLRKDGEFLMEKNSFCVEPYGTKHCINLP